MQTIWLRAWDEQPVELSDSQAALLADSGLVRAQVDGAPDRWRLKTDSHIGVEGYGDWEIRVEPKLMIPKLMFLLGFAADPSGWRDAIAAYNADDDLFAAVASAFALHGQRAISPAPIRGYVTVDDRATTLRGRLRFGEQLARWPGLPIPLELSHDDYTANIAENQMLRGAAELLLRIPRVSELARKRLLRIRATLEEVEPTQPSRNVEAPPITRLNDRYRAALALAGLILRGTSISTSAGGLTAASFVFDMNKVFEDFLSAALQTFLAGRGGRVELQYRRGRLDDRGWIHVIPDITWWRSGRIRAVIDAKYKPLKDERFPNADAYQMLAYCTAFGLPRGYLVYAKESGEVEHHHAIRNTNIEIEVTAVDVGLEPDDLLASVQSLAARIAHPIRA